MSIDINIPHGLQTRLEQLDALKRPTYRLQVEGPWNIGDPVHESITHAALIEAELAAQGTRFNDPATWEYIRGIFWNDDPEGFFFDHNDTETDNWSNGIKFLSNFKTHQHEAIQGTIFGPTAPLLARSHFGDLQCLHAMASRNGESAVITRDNLLRWAEFFYEVAIGTVSETASLSHMNAGHIDDWFPDSPLSIRALLLVGQKGNVRQRAMGALLHIVQDSFAKGHVERNQAGHIVEFHSYIHQDSSKHAKDDQVDSGGLQAMPEVQRAIRRCQEILELYKTTATWPSVRIHLEKRVFTLSPNARPSSPGQAYRA
ncbi:MAG: hypothetical protein LZF86_80061 [Nitrospira sp.]|nr:MAG: hypothetical protein LZF86_80061 [Nitrospira sp.]